MARQEFLNGGFIGKMGNLIGERWKTIRYVKAYAKPSNPKTPAQQEARAYFRTGLKLAQIAMRANGHDGLWDTSTRTEFQLRTGQAITDLRAGKDEEDSIPYYPHGKEPIQALTINEIYPDAATGKWLITYNAIDADSATGMMSIEGVRPYNTPPFGIIERAENLLPPTWQSSIDRINTIDPTSELKIRGAMQVTNGLVKTEVELTEWLKRPLAAGTTQLISTLTPTYNRKTNVLEIHLTDTSPTFPETDNIVIFTAVTFEWGFQFTGLPVMTKIDKLTYYWNMSSTPIKPNTPCYFSAFLPVRPTEWPYTLLFPLQMEIFP